MIDTFSQPLEITEPIQEAVLSADWSAGFLKLSADVHTNEPNTCFR